MSTQDIVFDLGGVLLNWQPKQLLCDLLPELALNEDRSAALGAQIFESFTPGSDWARFDLGLIEPSELSRNIAARTRLSEEQVSRIIGGIPQHLHALTDTVAVLQALAQTGHRLFFLSNMPAPYAAELIRRESFFTYFSAGIFSADVQHMKPQAAMFELAENRFGLAAAPVFIDDVQLNVDAACQRGWRGLRFEGAPALAQTLRGLGLLD